jgi:protein-S-isoprenylcysteine O-methyltransferase Ste14
MSTEPIVRRTGRSYKDFVDLVQKNSSAGIRYAQANLAPAFRAFCAVRFYNRPLLPAWRQNPRLESKGSMTRNPTQRSDKRLRRSILYFAGLGALPFLVNYVFLCVRDYQGLLVVPGWELLENLPVPTWTSTIVFASWLGLQAILQVIVPGRLVPGLPLADNSRLAYRLNGWPSFVITFVLLGLATYSGWLSPAFLFDELGGLLATANIFAFLFAILLYFSGRAMRHGSTDKIVLEDFFLGVKLNPRWRGFDFKFFFESRPGLMGWVILDLIMAAQQYERHGAVTTPMILVVAFQFLYVADYFWNEEAILSTWDIRAERFGWMLLWGDIVWVPFVYTLQAFYLVSHPHELPWWATAGIIVLDLAGYVIFRHANLQKHRFRKNPGSPIWGKKPEFISTSQGTPLLVSGWWGLARHCNYLGDLMMALAWCLPCLFSSPLPYFYFVYFVILLVHRERRDHHACHKKYGSSWDEYCRRVPWRIVPYIY